jgi:hypothetical protein
MSRWQTNNNAANKTKPNATPAAPANAKNAKTTPAPVAQPANTKNGLNNNNNNNNNPINNKTNPPPPPPPPQKKGQPPPPAPNNKTLGPNGAKNPNGSAVSPTPSRSTTPRMRDPKAGKVNIQCHSHV